jgi:hypothetical protein
LTPAHRRYLILESCLGAAVVNAALNAGLGWLATRGMTTFPVWRLPGVAADLAGTAFGVTFGTYIVMGFQVRREMARGRLSRLDLAPRVSAFLQRMPENRLRRAARLGLLSVPLFAAPVVAVLALAGVAVLGRSPFVVLKAGFSALEGAIVTPLIVLMLLAEAPRATPSSIA